MTKSNLDYWRLIDELSVIDAAILITGNDPSEKEQLYDVANDKPLYNSDGSFRYRQRTDFDNFEPTFKALRNAIFSNKLRAKLAYSSRDPLTRYTEYDFAGDRRYASYTHEDSEGEFIVTFDTLIQAQKYDCKIRTNREINTFQEATTLYVLKEPNWIETTVEVNDLQDWLKSRGFFPEFFFPQGSAAGFKDKNNSRYSPKLACAIGAWEAVKNAQPNKSVKESIALWVQSNGINFGMGNADGVVPIKAIEQVATVVNWDTRGGATPTYTKDIEEDDDEIENFTVLIDFDKNIPF